MMRCIVYTRKADNGVSICHPAPKAIAWMSCGGFWDGRPRGFMETQIERQIARGVDPDTARRYAHAVQFGGCTTAEALAIIRDRDCAMYGTAIELWDIEDVPSDRWFRDAWRRSHNGGPISVDVKKARPIQWTRARSFVSIENKRRAESFETAQPVEVDWDAFRQRIREAKDEVDLRAIWPLGRAA